MSEAKPRHQAVVLSRLRDLILNGHFPAGERLAEVPLTALLGVSRSPIRYALQVLSHEGLLEPAGQRGYRVRVFQGSDIEHAIDVRAVLEGLAARQACERGNGAALVTLLRSVLEEIDELLSRPNFAEDHVADYAELNGRFHDAIIQESGNEPLQAALLRNDRLPFAASRSVAFNASIKDSEVMRLKFAQWQHHQIVASLAKGDGARGGSADAGACVDRQDQHQRHEDAGTAGRAGDLRRSKK